MNRFFVVIGVLVLAVTANAGAKTYEAGVLPTASESDRAILATIVNQAVTAVKMCDLAMQKTSNRDIQAYCRNASADDGHIAVQGAQLAGRFGISDGSLLTSTQTPPAIDGLSRLSGSDFERSFLLTQIAADGSWAHAIRYSLEFSTNAPIKRFESSVMPIVLRHLDSAESILRNISESAP